MGSHPWPRSRGELEMVQAELAERARAAPPWVVPTDRPLRCAGVFVAFSPALPGHEPASTAAALLEGGRVIATALVGGRAGAPYSPGHLALQRGPLLESALRALEIIPDVVLVNATGRDHPRYAGLALHLGAALDLPTVGVTERPLVATAGEPGPDRGAATPLSLDGELAGFVLRTRGGARPVIAHAGWRTDPETAREVVLSSTGRARTPEPLRLARFLARVQRAREEGRLTAPVPPIGTLLRSG